MQLGFQLFHYLSRCSDTDNFSKCKYYIDVFNSDSAQTILEAAIEMKNIDVSMKTGNANVQKSWSHKIIAKLDMAEKLEYDNFYLLTSSKPKYNTSQCQVLQEQVKHLGNCYTN